MAHERRQKKAAEPHPQDQGADRVPESVLQKESSDDCSAVLQQIASIRGLWEG